MAGIILPGKFGAQPQYAAPIAAQFKRFKPIVAVLPAASQNIATNKAISRTGDAVVRGGNFYFPGTDGCVSLGAITPSTTGDLSIVVVSRIDSFPNSFPMIFGTQTAGGDAFEMFYSNFGTGYSDISIGTVGNGNYYVSLSKFGSVTGTWHRFVYTQSSVTTPKLWCNGVPLTLPGSPNGIGGFSGNAALGRQSVTDNTYPLAGKIAGFWIFQKRFPDALAKKVSAFPWQIHQALPRHLEFPSAAVVGGSAKFRSTLSAMGTRSGSRQAHR